MWVRSAVICILLGVIRVVIHTQRAVQMGSGSIIDAPCSITPEAIEQTASYATKMQQGGNTLTYPAYLKGNGGSTTVVPGSFTLVGNFTLAYQ
jgi:type 1 fimbria pilin